MLPENINYFIKKDLEFPLFQSNELWLGAPLFRGGGDLIVSLVGNNANVTGDLYIIYDSVETFLFKNKDNGANPTTINLNHLGIPAGAPLWFKYTVLSFPFQEENPSYSGQNRGPGDGWSDTDVYYSPVNRTAPNLLRNDYPPYRRWCVAGPRPGSDIIEVGFEDTAGFEAGGDDYDDIVFTVTGASLLTPYPNVPIQVVEI